MDTISRILDERTVSSFGVSIGTGLALEALFKPTTERYDKKRDIPDKLKASDYERHYFNIYTLARNCVSAVVGSKYDKDLLLTSRQLLDTVIEEVNIIADLYEDSGCTPILFVPDYTPLYRKFNAEKQGTIVNGDYLLREYVTKTLATKRVNIRMGVIDSGYKLKPTSKKVLLTTHVTADLLNAGKISNMFLLESHTGKLKNKQQWGTKYHTIGKLPIKIFPMVEELLFLLGDNNFTLPVKLKERRELHEYATAKKWTAYTSKIKIMSDLNSNQTFKQILRGYTRAY